MKLNMERIYVIESQKDRSLWIGAVCQICQKFSLSQTVKTRRLRGIEVFRDYID